MARARSELAFFDVSIGDTLPELVVPVSSTLIVSGAMASRDFSGRHHDPDVAHAEGAADISMNLATTNGLVSRYVTDWSGPRSRLSQISIRLGRANHPGDVMTLSGSVDAKGPLAADGESGLVTVSVRGTNQLGEHVTGTVLVVFPMEIAD
jgi:acyl dehydratase